MKTRREFLGETSCASLGSMAMLSSVLNLKLLNQAAAADLPSGNVSRKSLVCILLAGGNDSFNMLLRRDTSGHNAYKNSRSNLAIGQAGNDPNGNGAMIPINRAGGETGTERFALHPACTELADMFNGTGDFTAGPCLSFLSNIGTLIQPTAKTDLSNSNFPLPKSLFSHIDQITQWQTSIPQGQIQATGWAGRMADVLHSTQNVGTTASSMSISLAGNNVFQIGNSTAQFSITGDGALLPSGSNPGLNDFTARKNYAFQNLVEGNYNNLIQQAYANHTKTSIDAQAAFKTVYDSINVPANLVNKFPNTKFGDELLAAAKTLQARTQLGLSRSTIFVERGGWDHHGGLLAPHNTMLGEISQAIAAYQLVINHFGLQEEVITYTASDFGRTLRSNGRGTDHAWGGNQMVWGGPITGGKIFGDFPDLSLNSSDDIGLGGRILPTTSVDEFFAEMAVWFGVSNTHIHDYVLPNLSNFVPNIATNPKPVGFIS